MRYAHIVGWGKYAPEKVLTNDDVAKIVDTSDGWIRKMTGIGQRHIAGPRETLTTMAAAAGLAALDCAGISASELDMIIVASTSPERPFPSTACLVQDALGAEHAGAFDLAAACSGFIYGLSLASDAIRAGSCSCALVIGSEAMSRIVDWKDRNTCVLFGDGAGAVVLKGSDQPGGVLSTLLRSDGSGGDVLYINSATGEDVGTTAPAPHTLLQMNGREVFRFATRVMGRATREVMNKAGWQVDEVDLVIPHQANVRIIEAAAKELAMPQEKLYCNIEHYGNTSAASIPIAICDAVEEGRMHPNDKVVMVGFGAGLTWAAAAVEWGVPVVVPRSNRVISRLRQGVSNVRSRARRAARHVEDRLFGTIDLSMMPQSGAPSSLQSGLPAAPNTAPHAAPGRNGYSADHKPAQQQSAKPAEGASAGDKSGRGRAGS
jgi:3-oxoacyl-[acyl-carrier-protein] synthase III